MHLFRLPQGDDLLTIHFFMGTLITLRIYVIEIYRSSTFEEVVSESAEQLANLLSDEHARQQFKYFLHTRSHIFVLRSSLN